ncbi:unnamed protein product [Macrosiphum euphorbiae]|nr:unnamed protein product [Macrosiphum euphorbiae]
MTNTSEQNSDDEEINELYAKMKNLKKIKNNINSKQKKQKITMSTSNQNSDDEEIDEHYGNRINQIQNLKNVKSIIKSKPKKQKFQSHLLKLEQEYDGSTLNNQNCIRVKKPGGGNFSIKIPVNQGGGDYLVVQKYKTADMEKVESKERWKTSTFNAKIILDEKDKADNAIISAFNNLQDLMMDKFMCNDDKQIESYQ